MNILVIHGENTQDSYKRLKEATKKAKGKGWEIERSLDNLRSSSLFTSKRAFILYFDTKMPVKFLNSLPKEAKIEEFKLPKPIFNFLDSFYPGNTKNSLRLFHEAVSTEVPEFVFALLGRQLRDLYWATSSLETLNYPSWRIGKLKSQASKFSPTLLSKIISEIAMIDTETKTGKADLILSLDLLMVSKLQ